MVAPAVFAAGSRQFSGEWDRRTGTLGYFRWPELHRVRHFHVAHPRTGLVVGATVAGWENRRMTDGLAGIITLLEQRKTAIDRALMALREVGDTTAPGLTVPASIVKPEASARKGKKRSAAVRKRMKEAQRLRWAKIRGESEPAPEAPKAKRKISPEGMKRIIAATKKRWALKRAEAKAGLKKTI